MSKNFHVVKVNQGKLKTQFTKREIDPERCRSMRVNNDQEKELVKFCFEHLLQNVDEGEVVKFIGGMDKADIRFVDVIKACAAGEKKRKSLDNPVDRVKLYLNRRYGEKEATERLRKMSGEEVLSLDEMIKKNQDPHENPDGSLNLPPLFQREGYEPERQSKDGALRLPPMSELITGKPEESKKDDGPLQTPRMKFDR